MDGDDLLVQRAKRGDRAAVETLLRTHHDMVRAVCHRIVTNRHDAEDAVQNALIAIVRALPSFDGRAKFSTWIHRIAVNAALDEIRRIRRRAVPVDADDLRPAATPERTGAVDARLDVQSALARVPEEYRVALVLRHVADLDYADIAVVLDIPVGTVRSRLSRGKEHLEALLADGPGNHDASGVVR